MPCSITGRAGRSEVELGSMKIEIQIRSGETKSLHSIEPATDAWPPPAAQGSLRGTLDGQSVEVDWAEISPGVYSMLLEGTTYEVWVRRPAAHENPRNGEFRAAVGLNLYSVEVLDPRARRKGRGRDAAHGPQEILAPMPGKIVRILVEENQEVAVNQGLLVIEAMKMQNELRSPRAGRVEKVFVAAGGGVETGAKLVRLS
jgi:biotin carboxyl carrier protein